MVTLSASGVWRGTWDLSVGAFLRDRQADLVVVMKEKPWYLQAAAAS